MRAKKSNKTKSSNSVATKKALTAYSSGEISRTELESKTGLWLGEVLLELEIPKCT